MKLKLQSLKLHGVASRKLLSRSLLVVGLAVSFSFTSETFTVQEASAGELVGAPRRIRNTSTYGRRIMRSTNAVKKLRGAKSSRPLTLQQSSPYEYRIIQAANDQQKYEQKLVKYENRIERQENRVVAKKRKTEEKELAQAKKKLLREREKAARAEERKQKEQEKQLAKTTRAQQQQVATATNGKKNGERFAAPTGAEKEGTQRRLTLWQRIKLWFTGANA